MTVRTRVEMIRRRFSWMKKVGEWEDDRVEWSRDDDVEDPRDWSIIFAVAQTKTTNEGRESVCESSCSDESVRMTDRDEIDLTSAFDRWIRKGRRVRKQSFPRSPKWTSIEEGFKEEELTVDWLPVLMTGAAEWILNGGAHDIFFKCWGALTVFSWDSAGRKRYFMKIYKSWGAQAPPAPPLPPPMAHDTEISITPIRRVIGNERIRGRFCDLRICWICRQASKVCHNSTRKSFHLSILNENRFRSVRTILDVLVFSKETIDMPIETRNIVEIGTIGWLIGNNVSKWSTSIVKRLKTDSKFHPSLVYWREWRERSFPWTTEMFHFDDIRRWSIQFSKWIQSMMVHKWSRILVDELSSA